MYHHRVGGARSGLRAPPAERAMAPHHPAGGAAAVRRSHGVADRRWGARAARRTEAARRLSHGRGRSDEALARPLGRVARPSGAAREQPERGAVRYLGGGLRALRRDLGLAMASEAGGRPHAIRVRDGSFRWRVGAHPVPADGRIAHCGSGPCAGRLWPMASVRGGSRRAIGGIGAIGTRGGIGA